MENNIILTRGASGTALKFLALIAMTIDHIGMIFLPQYRVLRMIGRIAFPIFAYMIAEGCRYTHNKIVYWGRLAVLGVISQIVSFIFTGDLKMCIFISFALAIPVIFAIHSKHDTISAHVRLALSICLVITVTTAVPSVIPGFSVDYGLWGVLLPVFISLGRNKKERLMWAAIGMIQLSYQLGGVQWLSLFSLVPLAMYNGTRGKYPMKTLFYLYYPLHLAALYILSTAL